MEEIFIIVFELIEDADLIAFSDLIISEEILSELAFDMNILADVYTEMLESLEVFKGWMMKTFEFTQDVVNAILGLQLIYNMIYTHYQKVSESGQCISLEVALEDIEGTLKKNYQKMLALAAKEIASSKFNTLPQDVQDKIREIMGQSPMQYWLSSKPGILSALKKLPIYNG